MSRVCVFLAEGFEEIEALTVVDLLRRANVQTEMVSIGDTKQVTGAHGIKVEADLLFKEMKTDDVTMLVLPGGMPGTVHLEEYEPLTSLLKKYAKEEKFISAICAAPRVLGGLGLLEGRRACCYPGVEERLTGAMTSENSVEVDGPFITSRGLGTAIPFAGAIIERLCGADTARQKLNEIVYKGNGTAE